MKREMNLLDALSRRKKSEKRIKNPRAVALWTLLVIALAAGGVLFARGYTAQFDALSSEKERLSSYVNDPDNALEYERRLDVMARLGVLDSYNDRNALYASQLDSSNRIGSKDFREVDRLAPATVIAKSYAFVDDTLEIACSTPDKDDPARYAESLTKSGLFRDVGYYGFMSYDDGGLMLYSFTVRCLLWPSNYSAEGGN